MALHYLSRKSSRVFSSSVSKDHYLPLSGFDVGKSEWLEKAIQLETVPKVPADITSTNNHSAPRILADLVIAYDELEHKENYIVIRIFVLMVLVLLFMIVISWLISSIGHQAQISKSKPININYIASF